MPNKQIKSIHLPNAGAQIDIEDEHEATPLLYAARKGHLPTIQFLVEVGAKINAQNDEGNTALHIVRAFSIFL
jgi:ankyrin repeat protein